MFLVLRSARTGLRRHAIQRLPRLGELQLAVLELRRHRVRTSLSMLERDGLGLVAFVDPLFELLIPISLRVPRVP